MKKRLLKVLSLLLAVLLIGSLFIGCTQKQTTAETPKDNVQEKNNSKTEEKPAQEKTSGKITDKPLTLKYWCGIPGDKVAPVHKNLGEIKLYQELEKRTGIHIEFLHPPVGQENEQFNLLVASGDYPDLIERDFSGYPGGPEKAIQDNVIIKVNDIIEKYSPNLKKLLDSNKEYQKLLKTDTGTYYAYPFIRGHASLMVFYGPQFRQDWLDELGLQVPETIEEWYVVLKAFKEKKNTIPFTFRTGDISNGHAMPGAWGVAKGFYLDSGKVKFGPMEPGWKEFLTTFAKWYKEGLIDPDFASQDSKTWDAKITGNKAGAFLGYAGGAMGRFLNLMKDKDPKFKLVGAPNPSLTKGGRAFGQRDWDAYPNVSISTACKKTKEAAMWLDYGYSEEGNMLYNFGIEGESYKLENGYPKYTDIITKNPNGLPMGQAMSNYMRSHYAGPFVQRKEYFEQFMQYESQVKAIEQWAKADPSYRMPRVTPTPEETQTFSAIMSEVNTYVDEMMVKFIMGQADLGTFDEYVGNLKKMKIDEAIKIQEAALERYNNR